MNNNNKILIEQDTQGIAFLYNILVHGEFWFLLIQACGAVYH